MKILKHIILTCLLTINFSCNKPLSHLECHQSGFKVSISWDQIASTLTANITNGASPFTYKWSNGLGNFQTINVHDKGTYSVTVTDYESCEAYANFTIK